MMLDGRQIAADILAEVRARVSGKNPVVEAVVASPTPATESYLRIKTKKAEEAGMTLSLVRLPEGASLKEAIAAAESSDADARIVQLPLPKDLDERAVLDAIPLPKDADVLSTAAYGRFVGNLPGSLTPPVVCAVSELLRYAGIHPKGKRIVVVGGGRLVGAPTSVWLAREGGDVTVLTANTFPEKKAILKEADIIIAGAGSPRLITPDLISPGVVCIDAGTSESEGSIVGDFDPACAEVAGSFTPVPGGVGPVAVACLFKNVAQLLESSRF